MQFTAQSEDNYQLPCACQKHPQAEACSLYWQPQKQMHLASHACQAGCIMLRSPCAVDAGLRHHIIARHSAHDASRSSPAADRATTVDPHGQPQHNSY